MKTKILLHGGRLKLKDERNDSYFRELTKELQDGDTVLFIGFARPDEAERNEVYQREKGFFLAQTNKKLQVINATHTDLINQIKIAKAVHITGGQSAELVKDIRKYPDFVDAIQGKVVGGSSAGACLFSTYYFSNTAAGVLPGLGTLPIRLMVHYGNPEYRGTDETVRLLDTYPKELELLLLEECAWVTRQIES